MRFVTTLLYTLVAFTTLGYSQDSTRRSTAMKKIFIEPAALIDIFNGPSLRLGAEFPIAYRWSIIGTYGFYGCGYYLKGGIKAYIKEDMYIELSFMRKNAWHTVNDNVENFDSSGNNGKPGATVDYAVHQNVWGIHAEYGWQAPAWRHWSLEVYGGVGVKFRTVSISIPDTLQQTLYDFQEGDVARASDVPVHNLARISLVGGVRIGYCFRRKREKE